MKQAKGGNGAAANSTECVKVTVRCRPMNKKETSEGMIANFHLNTQFLTLIPT